MGCRTPPPAKKGDGIRMWLGDAWGDLGFIAQEDGQAQKASQIWNLGDNSTSPETPKWALCLFFFILNYQGRLERKISRLTSHNSFSLGYEGLNQQDTISCMGEKCRSNWKHSRQVSSCASWAKPIDGKGNLIGRKKKRSKEGMDGLSLLSIRTMTSMQSLKTMLQQQSEWYTGRTCLPWWPLMPHIILASSDIQQKHGT